jgi:hypothetical protein
MFKDEDYDYFLLAALITVKTPYSKDDLVT